MNADTPAPTGQPLTEDEREALGDACDAEREALGDACDAAYDFGDAWVRFTRNGNESMLLPVVERIVAARVQAAADRARAEALREAADVAEGLRALADEFHEAIEMPQDLPPEAYSRGWLAACGMAERRIRALLAAFDVRRRAEG